MRSEASHGAAPRVGLLGPLLTTLVAAGLALIVFGRFAAERADTVTAWAAQAAADALARDAAPQARVAALAEIGDGPALLPRVVEDDPAPRRYAFLRVLRYAAHPVRPRAALDPASDADKAAADAFGRGLARPDVRWVGGDVARAAAPAGPARVAVVDAARAELLASPALHFVAVLAGALLGLLAWLALLRRGPSRWAAPAGAALTGVGVLAALWWGASALGAATDAAAHGLALRTAGVPAPPPVAAGEWALLFAAPLLPLVVFAVIGAMSASRRSPHRVAYAYVTPAMLGMAVLILVPFGLGVALAFTRHEHGTFTFVGLQNFARILKSEGFALTHPLSFYFTLGVTILWTGLNVALHAAIGLGLALILREPTLRLKGVYRVLLIVPWAVPNYITALIWKGMFNKQYGLINHLLGLVGVEPVGWFSQFWTAFAANVTTNTWLGFPFMMVVALGALQSIPRDLYEAADVDGASRWQQFRHITLPLLRPALLPAIILGSVWTFNMFNIIYLVSGGQPNGATDILIVEAYRWAFEQDRYGYAAAYSVLIFLVLLAYSGLTNRLSRSAEGAYG